MVRKIDGGFQMMPRPTLPSPPQILNLNFGCESVFCYSDLERAKILLKLFSILVRNIEQCNVKLVQDGVKQACQIGCRLQV